MSRIKCLFFHYKNVTITFACIMHKGKQGTSILILNQTYLSADRWYLMFYICQKEIIIISVPITVEFTFLGQISLFFCTRPLMFFQVHKIFLVQFIVCLVRIYMVLKTIKIQSYNSKVLSLFQKPLLWGKTRYPILPPHLSLNSGLFHLRLTYIFYITHIKMGKYDRNTKQFKLKLCAI